MRLSGCPVCFISREERHLFLRMVVVEKREAAAKLTKVKYPGLHFVIDTCKLGTIP